MPGIVFMQHEGGGRYGGMQWASGARMVPTVFHSALSDFHKYSKVKSTGASGASVYFDCQEIGAVKSDAALLAFIKKNVDNPNDLLAAHFSPGRDWVVETEDGRPVMKSRVLIVYWRRGK